MHTWRKEAFAGSNQAERVIEQYKRNRAPQLDNPALYEHVKALL